MRVVTSFKDVYFAFAKNRKRSSQTVSFFYLRVYTDRSLCVLRCAYFLRRIFFLFCDQVFSFIWILFRLFVNNLFIFLFLVLKVIDNFRCLLQETLTVLKDAIAMITSLDIVVTRLRSALQVNVPVATGTGTEIHLDNAPRTVLLDTIITLTDAMMMPNGIPVALPRLGVPPEVLPERIGKRTNVMRLPYGNARVSLHVGRLPRILRVAPPAWSPPGNRLVATVTIQPVLWTAMIRRRRRTRIFVSLRLLRNVEKRTMRIRIHPLRASIWSWRMRISRMRRRIRMKIRTRRRILLLPLLPLKWHWFH
jgi:hypothetical protein